MSDVIHNSAMRDMRHCEQFYAYRHIEGLQEEFSAPLSVGTWFHLLMEAQGLRQGTKQGTLLHDVPERLYFGLPDEDTPSVETSEVLDESGVIDVRLVHRWAVEEVYSFMPIDPDDDDLAQMPGNLWFLYERYMARHGATMVKEQVLGVEVQWQREDGIIPALGEKGVILYGGQADRIVRNERGLFVARDHKSTGKKPSASFLLTDSQLHLYAWGLQPWLDEHEITLDAIEYDFALTYWPSVRLTKAGNLYKNQKVIDFHAAAMLLQQVLDVDDYDYDINDDRFSSWLQKCKDEGDREFFKRHLQPVNETTITSLLDDGAVLASRMHHLAQGNYAPIRNMGRHCDWCPMQDVCTGDLLGNDTTPLKDDMR